MIKLHVLIENTTKDPKFLSEHGLSLFIETDRHKILFDSGKSEKFAENAQKMGIDLKEADIAVLSHGHYDHGGGLEKFLEINDIAPVYVNRHAFLPLFYRMDQYIGLKGSLASNPRLHCIDDFLKIDETISLYSCNGRLCFPPAEGADMYMLYQGRMMPDEFWHEHYLLIQDGKRKILFSGCSHKGILNIAKWFQPDVLVGGFHFMDMDPDNTADQKYLEQAANALLEYPTEYYTGHCTGTKPYQFLKNIMGNRLHAISSGESYLL